MRDYEPRRIVHIDLADPQWPSVPGDQRDVQAFFWSGDLPLGSLLLASAQARPSAATVDLVASAVAPALREWLGPQGIHAWKELAGSDPLALLAAERDVHGTHSVSVVICTRDRAAELERCLRSIAGCSPPPDEIVVVDNAPSTSCAEEVVRSFSRARYVVEPKPGLSHARNTGVAHATGDMIAFTDDDAVVHPAWIGRLKRAFADPAVASVTGLVLPAELDTTSQVFFETALGGFGRGFVPRSFGEEFLRAAATKGPEVWKLGAGANMALRRDLIIELGGFDGRLGAGAAGCSEDSELWYRVLASGSAHRYDPSAVVFHYHRRDMEGLRAQARAYVEGHVAALFVQYARHRHVGNLLRALFVLPYWYARRLVRHIAKRALGVVSTYPEDVRGYLRGLRHLPLVWRRPPDPPFAASGASRPGSRPQASPSVAGRRERGAFLRFNPYPHPRSEGFFYREKMRAIYWVTPEIRPSRVLDIGGGQSGLASMLFPAASVTTIDRELSYAASRLNAHPNQRFLAADACRLPFGNASFEVVTLFDVLEHIPDDGSAVCETLRVLRPGGWVIVTSPNERWRFPYHRPLAPVCPSDQDVMADWGHVRRGYRVEDLERLFGMRTVGSATFINPLTVISHDLAFSHLPARARHAACLALTPLTWLGYALHRPGSVGTETATAWRKP